MKNNVDNFRRPAKDQLKNNILIKELDRALLVFPYRIVDYVRNGRDVTDVLKRAEKAIFEMDGALVRLIKPLVDAAQAIVDDPNSTREESKAARQFLALAQPFPKCSYPQIWDPVTKQCVDP